MPFRSPSLLATSTEPVRHRHSEPQSGFTPIQDESVPRGEDSVVQIVGNGAGQVGDGLDQLLAWLARVEETQTAFDFEYLATGPGDETGRTVVVGVFAPLQSRCQPTLSARVA